MHDLVDSPVGVLTVTRAGDAVTGVRFPSHRHPVDPDLLGTRDPERLAPAARQLADYFDGQRRDFDVALAPLGTPFQLRVWEALCAIPYGTTTSYGELARAIGQPTASRAVGAANGRNRSASSCPATA